VIRTWKVTILRSTHPLLEQVLTTRRGVGSLVLFVHESFPDAEFVYAEAV
jgi:hypothetical protein